jgi:PAS domain S-box-containing protein
VLVDVEAHDHEALRSVAASLGLHAHAWVPGTTFPAAAIAVMIGGTGGAARALHSAAAVRANPRARHTPILFLAPAASAAELLAAAPALGLTDCLHSPVTPAEAHARLRLVSTLGGTAETREIARVQADSDRRKRLYETILANTPDLAYVFGLDHRFTYANEVLLRMWGRTWDEAIGRNCRELGYPQWHAEMHDREIEQVKATRQPIRGEVPFEGAFGPRIYEYIFVPVLGPDGEVEAVAGTTRDVTDRKHAEEEMARLLDSLREASRVKDQFIATLAHELRNPLAPIQSGLSALRLQDARDNPLIDMLERQFAHLVHLVEDLLDVSRVTSGKITLRRAPIELRDVVRAALETVRPLVEANRQTLQVSLPDEPMPLDGDATRLAQVLTNILNNASKYTLEGGRIELRASREDGEVVLRVQDSGVGIPAAMLDKVFDAFTQVGSTVERAQGGLGVGLALVRKLVELHGGRVDAQSPGAGKGSTFTVRLPLAQAAPAEVAQVAMPAPAAPAVHGPALRILVVDDNVDAANSLALLLGFHGHATQIAHTGRDALENARATPPEVVFLDIGLPDMHGYDVARTLRSDPLTARATLVALTGWGSDDDQKRALDAGFDVHLTKPAPYSVVAALLARVHAA